MARVTNIEAKELSAKGGNFDFNFFTLKDKEVKKVRFLYSNIEQVQAFTVHQIQLQDGKRKTVDCIRAMNEPVQLCPLCASGIKPKARVYISLLDESSKEVLVWERSGQFIDELEGFFTRYGDLRDCVFEIERRGTGLDTKYQIYFLGTNPIIDKSILPEPVDVYGKLVLTKNKDELATFVNTGILPEDINPVSTTPDNNQYNYQQYNNDNYQSQSQQQSSQPQNKSNITRRTGW